MTGPVEDHLKLVGTPQLLGPPSAKPPEELEPPLEPELPELPLEPELPELPLEPEPPLDPDAPVDPELPLLEPELALDPVVEPDAPPDPDDDPLLADPLASGDELEWSPPEPQAQSAAVAAATPKRVRAPMRNPSLAFVEAARGCELESRRLTGQSWVQGQETFYQGPLDTRPMVTSST
jgi:hypothetical protein